MGVEHESLERAPGFGGLTPGKWKDFDPDAALANQHGETSKDHAKSLVKTPSQIRMDAAKAIAQDDIPDHVPTREAAAVLTPSMILNGRIDREDITKALEFDRTSLQLEDASENLDRGGTCGRVKPSDLYFDDAQGRFDVPDLDSFGAGASRPHLVVEARVRDPELRRPSFPHDWPPKSQRGICNIHPILLNVIGCIHSLVTGGAVLGWAAIVPGLVEEGAFAWLCSPHAVLCPSRSWALTLVFTFAATGTYLSSITFLNVVDRYGPRMCGLLFSIAYGLGAICVAALGDLGLCVGMFLMGWTGPGIQFSTHSFANYYPKRKGLIRHINAACFDASAGMFLLISITATSSGISVRNMFWFYACAPGFTFCCACLLWPRNSVDQYVDPNAVTDTDSDTELESFAEKMAIDDDVGYTSEYLQWGRRKGRVNNVGRYYGKPLAVQIKSKALWFMFLFTSVHFLRMNWVIGTLHDQVVRASVDDRIILVFSMITAFGFLIAPASVYLLNNRPFFATIMVINAGGLMYGVIQVALPFAENSGVEFILYFGFFVLACSRRMVHSSMLHIVGKHYGPNNFGTIVGIDNLMVALMGFLQPILTWVSLYLFNENYVWANVLLLFSVAPFFFGEQVFKRDLTPTQQTAASP